MPRRHYHKATYELLGARPDPNPEREHLLDEVERQRGFRLPASMREWYSRMGDAALMGFAPDHPVRLSELGQARHGYDGLADNLLLILCENQACCWWAVRLNSSPDPPVVNLQRFVNGWREAYLVTDSFSAFVLARIWAQDMAAGGTAGALGSGGGPPLTPEILALLRANCREGPRTRDWPSGLHQHFEYQKGFIWVAGKGHADWFIGSPWRSGLVAAARLLWHMISPEWYEEPGHQVHQEIESHPPPYPGPGWENVFGEDLATRFGNGLWLHSPSDKALPPPAVDFLTDHFDHQERRTFDNLTAYRFFSPSSRVYVVTEPHGGEEAKASWWLHADTTEDLEWLAHTVCRWGKLRQSLETRSPAARSALERVARGG
jgi:hypothetical protein